MRADVPIAKSLALIALPTFGQLIAEPVFVLADTAIVGHISPQALAGLAVGSTLVLTAVGLCIFLAYATTSQVAKLFGAGRREEGLRLGMDDLWLSLVIGLGLAVLLFAFAEPLCAFLGVEGADLDQAVIYSRAVVLGMPGMLLVYAANGLYRGLQKVSLTLIVAVAGALLNLGLDVLFVIFWGWGISGSGFATFIAQWAMGIALVVPAIFWARKAGVSIAPHPGGIVSAGLEGLPLFVRTLALRVGIVATVMAAAVLGTEALAAYQVVNAAWSLMLNLLDSVAIAGQMLVGVQLGAGNRNEARRITRITLQAGLGLGAIVGVVFLGAGLVIPEWFSTDPGIQRLTTIGMVVTGLALSLQGWMWGADGILIGAGDFTYLAWTCSAVTGVYLALLAGLAFILAPRLDDVAVAYGFLWLAFDLGLMGGRALTNGLRIRTDAWMPPSLQTSASLAVSGRE